MQLVKTKINRGQGLSKTEYKVNSRGHGLVALVMSLWMHFTALTAAQEAEEYQGDEGSEDKEKEEEEEEELDNQIAAHGLRTRKLTGLNKNHSG